MTQTRYILGYHHRWEVYLHYIRWQSRQTGIELPRELENKMMAAWLESNQKTCDEETPCTICQDEIADGLLSKYDPFKMPASIKKLFQDLGSKFYKRTT